MKNKLFKLFTFLFVFTVAAFAQTETDSGSSIDWPQVLMTIGYLLGVFILLPLTIYTNNKEKLQLASNPKSNLSDEERNTLASKVLDEIEVSLSPFTAEDGTEMLTIENAKQAKKTKQGLEYILNILAPSNEDVLARTNEFQELYSARTKRIFTGSKWVIIAAVAVGVLMLATAGIDTFIFIHALGIAFYILSSRTTIYAFEKRMDRFGGGGGMIGRIMSALFIGEGTKYYVKEGDGPWQRDWETEGMMSLIGLMFLVIAALVLGLMAAFMGVLNFVINYATTVIIPFVKPKGLLETVDV